MFANKNASKYRAYFIKLLHNSLPTLSIMHKFKPDLYLHNICNRCHLAPETNDHLWTCSSSIITINTIKHQVIAKIKKLVLSSHGITHHLASSQTIIIDNFCKNSYCLNNALLSTNINRKPGYIHLFKGFVTNELTELFKSFNLPHTQASELAAKFIIWFAKKGFKLIWLARCEQQIKIEKNNSIFARHKKRSKKRTGRPPNTSTSTSYNNIFKTQMEPNLCTCKFSALAHINGQCPDEGLANIQGDGITSLIYSLQAENDLFINPIGFS